MRFPPWSVVRKYMPEVFKKQYPNTRVIIDATEFAIERPSSLLSKSSTFSNYKNRNNIKALIGITPTLLSLKVTRVPYLTESWWSKMGSLKCLNQVMM